MHRLFLGDVAIPESIRPPFLRHHVQVERLPPSIPSLAGGNGELVIHRAAYGCDGKMAVLTNHLRAKVKNGAIDEVCGNQLGGDPRYGKGKVLTIDYSYRDQRKTVNVDENKRIKLP